MKKQIVWFITLLASFLLSIFELSAQSLDDFVNLYPDCDDNQSSQVYEASSWPKGLRAPEFPGGGYINQIRFIQNQLYRDYPDVVDSIVPSKIPGNPDIVYRAKGTVLIHAIIDRCGRLTNPTVLKSVNEAYDQAALKIMENMPIYQPAALNGVRVKVGVVISVEFGRSALPQKSEWELQQEQENNYYDDGGSYYGGDW